MKIHPRHLFSDKFGLNFREFNKNDVNNSIINMIGSFFYFRFFWWAFPALDTVSNCKNFLAAASVLERKKFAEVARAPRPFLLTPLAPSLGSPLLFSQSPPRQPQRPLVRVDGRFGSTTTTPSPSKRVPTKRVFQIGFPG